MEWLSDRRQMKCFPPPSKEGGPTVKSEVILFIQPIQAWTSVWPQMQAKSSQWFTGATWAWIMCTHAFESLIIFTQIIPFFFPHLPESVWVLFCVLKQKGVYKRCSWVCGNVNELHLCPRHPERRRRATRRAGWNLPAVSAFCLHLYCGLCSSPTSSCVCSCVIVCYGTHSSVFTPWLPGDRQLHYTGESTGQSFQAKVPEHREVTFQEPVRMLRLLSAPGFLHIIYVGKRYKKKA